MNIKNISFISDNNIFKRNNNFSSKVVSFPSSVKINNSLTGDIVSFSGKRYEEETIINPTNHCAYCGCKVYNQQQIDSLAKEIMNSRAGRLEGKIKSVREKLSEAKNSLELASAKKESNKKEIEFFDKLLELSSTRSYMNGEEIFKTVYQIDKEDALKIITDNLKPLQKTIDHVSPQNLEQKNNNSDINLVESCTCCNGRLKEGMTFDEFYLMFPSIKNNMPSNKFDYAINNMLDISQDNILKRLSAINLLKHLSLLFVQRKEASNYLDSIDFRIKTCNSSIQGAIDSCKDEISEKESQVDELKSKLSELNSDPEYTAIVKRQKLTGDIDVINNLITSLKGKRERTSNKINEIRNNNTSKKSKKKTKTNVKPLTKEEADREVSNLKAELQSLTSQIESREENKRKLLNEISDLDINYPTKEKYIEMKSEAERIYNSYLNIENLKIDLASNEAEYNDISNELENVNLFLETFSDSDFNINDYSKEEIQRYERYNELSEALNYIIAHPNGGSIRSCIHSAAKKNIEQELDSIKGSDSVIDYKVNSEKKKIQKYSEKLSKQLELIQHKINSNKKEIIQNQRIISKMSKDEAYSKMIDYSEAIKRLNEKENQIKIPQNISKLQAEITLLNNTIADLLKKQSEIIGTSSNSQI